MIQVRVDYDDTYAWNVLNEFHLDCGGVYDQAMEVRYNDWRAFEFDGKYRYVDFIAHDYSRVIVKPISPSYWGFDMFVSTPVPMEFVYKE